jgi:hypothetical protein
MPVLLGSSWEAAPPETAVGHLLAELVAPVIENDGNF